MTKVRKLLYLDNSLLSPFQIQWPSHTVKNINLFVSSGIICLIQSKINSGQIYWPRFKISVRSGKRLYIIIFTTGSLELAEIFNIISKNCVSWKTQNFLVSERHRYSSCNTAKQDHYEVYYAYSMVTLAKFALTFFSALLFKIMKQVFFSKKK